MEGLLARCMPRALPFFSAWAGPTPLAIRSIVGVIREIVPTKRVLASLGFDV
jgi:hypothetical protein